MRYIPIVLGMLIGAGFMGLAIYLASHNHNQQPNVWILFFFLIGLFMVGRAITELEE